MEEREEAAYYYRRYAEAFEEAKRDYWGAKAKVETYAEQKKTSQQQLGTCNANKKNLEKRLEDVQGIIKLFDCSVEDAIASANRTAAKADERYISAIRCSSIVNASIQTAYQTKMVSEDCDTANAYQLCRKEEARLIAAIEELRVRIANLENAISSLSADISKCNSDIDYYEGEMRTNANRANSWASQM